MKKIVATALLLGSFFALPAFSAFPERNLQGIISWGAGGGTDGVFRAMTPVAEQTLGKSIILQNKPGATGAIAMTTVENMPNDGYTLLFAAENPAIYRILNLSKLSFHDFIPINIAVEGAVVICANPDSPYKTLPDLIDAAKSGASITMGTAGIGSLPYVAGAMMKQINGVTFNYVQFDGDGPGATAVMGGHVAAMPLALSTSVQFIRAGRLRGLAVLRTERVPQLPDVPAITEIYPEYAQYLPWGPFYGVFVRKGTPQDAVDRLTAAFQTAAADSRFKDFVNNFGGFMLDLSGAKAQEFLDRYEATASWLVYNAGGAQKSPADFQIPKP